MQHTEKQAPHQLSIRMTVGALHKHFILSVNIALEWILEYLLHILPPSVSQGNFIFDMALL